jgi:hypothetical protein
MLIYFVLIDLLYKIYSLQRRTSPDVDNEALAFKPVLGSMLGRIYNNPLNKEENQTRLQKILELWASKDIYDQSAIEVLKSEMIGGAPANSFSGPPATSGSVDPAAGKLDLSLSLACSSHIIQSMLKLGILYCHVIKLGLRRQFGCCTRTCQKLH